MNINFITSSEKKDIIFNLDKQFGIKELPYLLIKTGKEKIRAFTGHLSKDEIRKLSRKINIEIIGIYLIRKEHDFRLSLDATMLLKPRIKNNILAISDEHLKEWMRGNDLIIKMQRQTLVIKHNDDFIGCGRSTGEKIANYIPKDRRLRSKI